MSDNDLMILIEKDLAGIFRKYPKSEIFVREEIRSIIASSRGKRIPGLGPHEIRKERISLPEYNIGKSNALRLIYFTAAGKAMALYLYEKKAVKSESGVVKVLKKRIFEAVKLHGHTLI